MSRENVIVYQYLDAVGNWQGCTAIEQRMLWQRGIRTRLVVWADKPILRKRGMSPHEEVLFKAFWP